MSAFSEDKLPTAFVNEIVQVTPDIIIRSSVKNMIDINQWVKDFGMLTNTKWNTITSKPENSAIKIVCRKYFMCHHSCHMKKSAAENKRSFSKNTGCRASIAMKVKLDTYYTRKKDAFVKKGLPAVITIRDEHNHSLNTAEALKFLPPTVCKEKFIEYFESGMGVAESYHHHRKLLRLREDFKEEDMGDPRKNPTNRGVQYWYYSWRRKKKEAEKKALENDVLLTIRKILKDIDHEQKKKKAEKRALKNDVLLTIHNILKGIDDEQKKKEAEKRALENDVLLTIHNILKDIDDEESKQSGVEESGKLVENALNLDVELPKQSREDESSKTIKEHKEKPAKKIVNKPLKKNESISFKLQALKKKNWIQDMFIQKRLQAPLSPSEAIVIKEEIEINEEPNEEDIRQSMFDILSQLPATEDPSPPPNKRPRHFETPCTRQSLKTSASSSFSQENNQVVPGTSFSKTTTRKRGIKRAGSTLFSATSTLENDLDTSFSKMTTRKKGIKGAGNTQENDQEGPGTSVSKMTTRRKGNNRAGSISFSASSTQENYLNSPGTSVSKMTTRKKGINRAGSTSVSNMTTRQKVIKGASSTSFSASSPQQNKQDEAKANFSSMNPRRYGRDVPTPFSTPNTQQNGSLGVVSTPSSKKSSKKNVQDTPSTSVTIVKLRPHVSNSEKTISITSFSTVHPQQNSSDDVISKSSSKPSCQQNMQDTVGTAINIVNLQPNGNNGDSTSLSTSNTQLNERNEVRINFSTQQNTAIPVTSFSTVDPQPNSSNGVSSILSLNPNSELNVQYTPAYLTIIPPQFVINGIGGSSFLTQSLQPNELDSPLSTLIPQQIVIKDVAGSTYLTQCPNQNKGDTPIITSFSTMNPLQNDNNSISNSSSLKQIPHPNVQDPPGTSSSMVNHQPNGINGAATSISSSERKEDGTIFFTMNPPRNDIDIPGNSTSASIPCRNEPYETSAFLTSLNEVLQSMSKGTNLSFSTKSALPNEQNVTNGTSQSVQSDRDAANSPSVSNESEDDVDLFFKSIASNVKKLSPELIELAKVMSLKMLIELETRNSTL